MSFSSFFPFRLFLPQILFYIFHTFSFTQNRPIADRTAVAETPCTTTLAHIDSRAGLLHLARTVGEKWKRNWQSSYSGWQKTLPRLKGNETIAEESPVTLDPASRFHQWVELQFHLTSDLPLPSLRSCSLCSHPFYRSYDSSTLFTGLSLRTGPLLFKLLLFLSLAVLFLQFSYFLLSWIMEKEGCERFRSFSPGLFSPFALMDEPFAIWACPCWTPKAFSERLLAEFFGPCLYIYIYISSLAPVSV